MSIIYLSAMLVTICGGGIGIGTVMILSKDTDKVAALIILIGSILLLQLPFKINKEMTSNTHLVKMGHGEYIVNEDDDLEFKLYERK
jgi:hypothetical protein